MPSTILSSAQSGIGLTPTGAVIAHGSFSRPQSATSKARPKLLLLMMVFHRLMSLYPSAIYLAAFIVMLFYPLSKNVFEAMELELRQKKTDSPKS